MKYTVALFALCVPSVLAAKTTVVTVAKLENAFDFNQTIDAPSTVALPGKPDTVVARQNTAVMKALSTSDPKRENRWNKTFAAVPVTIIPTPYIDSGFPSGNVWSGRSSTPTPTLSRRN